MDPKRLLTEALQLPPEQRAALAGELIQSLDSQVDEEADEALEEAEEAARRCAERSAVAAIGFAEELDVAVAQIERALPRGRFMSTTHGGFYCGDSHTALFTA